MFDLQVTRYYYRSPTIPMLQSLIAIAAHKPWSGLRAQTHFPGIPEHDVWVSCLPWAADGTQTVQRVAPCIRLFALLTHKWKQKQTCWGVDQVGRCCFSRSAALSMAGIPRQGILWRIRTIIQDGILWRIRTIIQLASLERYCTGGRATQKW